MSVPISEPRSAPQPSAPPAPATARRGGRRTIPLVGALAGLLGVAIGTALGGGTGDPRESLEYTAVAQERDALTGDLADAESRADAAEAAVADLEGREAELDGLASTLEAREAAVTKREQEVTATEEQVAANQIGIGTWTVGTDVEPGTYRIGESVTSNCYWGIYRSGTNKADIVDNDIVSGGFPTVTLSDGQDFESDCGTWLKQ